MKRVGAIVMATDQGLGYLAKDFYDHGIIQEVFVWPHTSRTSHTEWYPNRVHSIGELLHKSDTLLFFETPFEWKTILNARNTGKKTVLMPMYECTPNPLPYHPDVVLSPSLLDKEYYPESTFLPVPVDVKWRQRKKAKVFVHNAGNGGLGGRNGTAELIAALPHIKSDIKLIIRSQVERRVPNDPRVKLVVGTVPKEELWDEGDVFIFPEKFNGLSLPLQEAYASGMAVIATDRFPMATCLPRGNLVEPSGYRMDRIATAFKSAIIQPEDLARKIDEVYDTDISEYSRMGKKWAEENSWEVLKPKYEEILWK